MKKTSAFSTTVLLCILTTIILIAGGCTCGSGNTEKNQPAAIESITTGETVKVTSETIKNSGGTITVDEPGSPIDGLNIQVATGAYDRDTRFDIAYSPIESHILGEEILSISPLIAIENGGKFADELIAVTVPTKIPEDHLPWLSIITSRRATSKAFPPSDRTASR